MFWAKDHGAIVCGAKEIQKKIFGAIVVGANFVGANVTQSKQIGTRVLDHNDHT